MTRLLNGRTMYVLAAMLGGYGILTVCLMLAAYLTSGAALATLVAIGGASISVPVTGLLALLGTWLQQSGPTTGDGGSDRTSSEQHAIRPAIDRSIVLIGNGYEHLRMKGGIEDFSIDTGSAWPSDRDPAPGPASPRADAGAGPDPTVGSGA